MTRIDDQDGGPSSACRSCLNRKNLAAATQASRITITPTSTATQKTVIRAPDTSEADSAASSRLVCRPMSRKTVFSSRNWMVCQLTRSASRDRPDWITGDRWPSSSPAVTTAITPDPWKSP